MEQNTNRHPQIKSAVRLTAREMNALRFSEKHTILTPEQLERLARSASPQ
ncbi:MAG: hypothetical protein K2H57_11625 [Duncaniella sp.]|nr:hypothetical protein [Duncaniella sp.]